jgi:hypothetical protein
MKQAFIAIISILSLLWGGSGFCCAAIVPTFPATHRTSTHTCCAKTDTDSSTSKVQTGTLTLATTTHTSTTQPCMIILPQTLPEGTASLVSSLKGSVFLSDRYKKFPSSHLPLGVAFSQLDRYEVSRWESNQWARNNSDRYLRLQRLLN